MLSRRPSSTAGIAIGPILFVLALLGILAGVLAAGTGGFSTIGVADRVTADVVSQANLIRSKINECQMQYIANAIDNSAAPPWDSVSDCEHDSYPCSVATGTLVSALTCPGDPLGSDSKQQSVWTGVRVTALPPPTAGFSDWKYLNAAASGGGRCIWTTGPYNSGVVAGLTQAATKFSSSEAKYSAGANPQKFVVIITPATGTLDSLCDVN